MDDLTTLIANILNVEPQQITDSTSMQTLANWDSFHHMKLINQIEKHYQCELSFTDIVAMTSIAKIRDVLQEKSSCAQ